MSNRLEDSILVVYHNYHERQSVVNMNLFLCYAYDYLDHWYKSSKWPDTIMLGPQFYQMFSDFVSVKTRTLKSVHWICLDLVSLRLSSIYRIKQSSKKFLNKHDV